MFRKTMKQKAKELLSGIWGRAIALLLALAAVSVFFSLFERTVTSLAGLSTLEQFFTPLLFYGNVTIAMWPFLFTTAVFVGSLFLSFLFVTPLRQGNVLWYYGRASGEIYSVYKAFSWYASFKKWLKVLAVYFLLFLKTFLWKVLFLLPAAAVYFIYCISVVYQVAAWMNFVLFILSAGLALCGLIISRVVCYRYFLVPYILADDPKVHIRTLFRSSVGIMQGKKSELFALDLSFLPYYALNVLIIPMLGTLPYINMTKALYAKQYILNYQLDVLAKKREAAEENIEI